MKRKMSGEDRFKIILRRVLANAAAVERENRADYRRKLEHVRGVAFILRRRIERGYGTDEEVELLAECEAALAADAADELVEFNEDEIDFLPALDAHPPEIGLEIRAQAMPVYGYQPAAARRAHWFADRQLPVIEREPRPDDVIEYGGGMYTVVDEVRYLRIVPCPLPAARGDS